MIRVGRGQGATLEESLEQAVAEFQSPQFVLYFSRPGMLDRVSAFFARRYEGIPTMGLCSVCVLHGGAVDEPDVLAVAFEEGFQISCGIIHDLDECPVQHVYRFEQDVKSIGKGNEDAVCLEYCTGNEEMLVTTLNAVLDKFAIPLMGSTAFESVDHMGRAQVAYNGGVYGNACIYAIIRSLHGKIRTYYENIYERTDLRLHQVTKVDTAHRRLIELDGRPAADVYCDTVQVSRDEIVKTNSRYPFGRLLGKKIYVSDVAEVLPDGSLCCNKRLNPNDAICFLDYGRYRAIAQETVERLQQENPNRYFMLTGDCIHRYWLYEDEHFTAEHAKNLLKISPYAGSVCGGEQYHHQHINQSLVLIVFSHDSKEGEGAE